MTPKSGNRFSDQIMLKEDVRVERIQPEQFVL
jgi:hypothetical protein